MIKESEYYNKAESLYARLGYNKQRLAKLVLNVSRPYVKELRIRLDKEKCYKCKKHENSLNKGLLLIEEVALGNFNPSESYRKLAREAAWGLNCLELSERDTYTVNQCEPRSRDIAKIITHTIEQLYGCKGPSRYNYKIIHLLHDVTHSWKEIVESMGEIMYEMAT